MKKFYPGVEKTQEKTDFNQDTTRINKLMQEQAQTAINQEIAS